VDPPFVTEDTTHPAPAASSEFAQLALRFLDQPTSGAAFRAAQDAVFRHTKYDPASKELVPLIELYSAGQYARAFTRLREEFPEDTEAQVVNGQIERIDSSRNQLRYLDTSPNQILSPRYHLLKTVLAERTGRKAESQAARLHATRCLEGLLTTGDATAGRPVHITRYSDEDDIVRLHFKTTVASRRSVQQGTRIFDVVVCNDQREIYFDVTVPASRRAALATAGATGSSTPTGIAPVPSPPPTVPTEGAKSRLTPTYSGNQSPVFFTYKFAESETSLKKPSVMTRTVSDNGIQLEAPTDWTSEKPRNSAQRMFIQIPGYNGSGRAELIATAVPGDARLIAACVQRWHDQFVDNPSVQTRQLRGRNADVTLVEMGGNYRGPLSNEPVRVGYSLAGALVVQGQTVYSFKLIGPQGTVNVATPAFEQAMKSLVLPSASQ
jgi:hypothetical protein